MRKQFVVEFAGFVIAMMAALTAVSFGFVLHYLSPRELGIAGLVVMLGGFAAIYLILKRETARQQAYPEIPLIEEASAEGYGHWRFG